MFYEAIKLHVFYMKEVARTINTCVGMIFSCIYLSHKLMYIWINSIIINEPPKSNRTIEPVVTEIAITLHRISQQAESSMLLSCMYILKSSVFFCG